MSPTQKAQLIGLATRFAPYLVMAGVLYATMTGAIQRLDAQKLDERRFLADSINTAHRLRELESHFNSIVGMYEDIRGDLRAIRCEGKPASCR